MRTDITKQQAKIILGQIRRRKTKVALFSASTGIKLKPVHRCTDSEIGDINFIGIYTKRATYQQVLDDWNDTI